MQIEVNLKINKSQKKLSKVSNVLRNRAEDNKNKADQDMLFQYYMKHSSALESTD